MLYVLIEAERARIKKLQEEKTRNLESSRKLEPRIVSEHRGGLRTEQTDIDVLGQHLTKEHVSSHSQSPIRDSQWFTLSPQEKLAWGTSSKDPRIAAGQQSPLEKKILSMGTYKAQINTRLGQETTRAVHSWDFSLWYHLLGPLAPLRAARLCSQSAWIQLPAWVSPALSLLVPQFPHL
nr:uncharacterized protein LOC105498580 isoform X2 [Macaca nemestrina]